MKRMVLWSMGWLSLFLVLCPSPASPQALNFERLEAGENRLGVIFGLDPAVLGAVGYTRTVAVGRRSMALSVELGVPVAELDARDYRGLVGAQMSLVQLGGFHLAAQGRLISRGIRSDIFDAHGFGVDLTTYTGYYGQRAFVALELGFDKELATHISHSEWYRQYIYENAVDGWYSSPGGTWHAGGLAGVALGRIELAMRAGLRRSQEGNELTPPLGGTISMTYVF